MNFRYTDSRSDHRSDNLEKIVSRCTPTFPGLPVLPILTVLLSILVISGCRGNSRDSLETKNLDVAGVELKVEIADTPEARNQGLMFRKSLGEDEGMIFVFEKESKVSFWMKNTEIPLSIAFIAADGTIRQIEDMEAQSLASVPSYRNVLYALEVNQGWFERNGISPGDLVDVSVLK